ncbi:MAG: stress-induced protein [Deltaproteobacteria bacterium]|nr:stress-induced protein [Deltaproteobacteria bacterium]
MKSMTGYARAEGRIGDRLCVVEIKTVNHRFLDIFLKTPKSLAPLELSLKKYLGTKISRGRVDATIQMENGAGNNVRVSLNLPLAKEYYKLINKLKEDLDVQENISLKHLISLQDVLVVEKTEDNVSQEKEIKVILDQALDFLNTMREAEGEALKQDLQQRITKIGRLVSDIETSASGLTNAYREKILKRFQDLNAPFTLDEPRFLTEVFLLAERADITEEVVRAKSHLKQCQDLLGLSDAIGRKLDFTLQEINREVNTMSAKASDAKISQAVIEIKSDLEKMREQVQNVE